MMSSQHIRERLSETAPPSSPVDIVMPPGSSRWPDAMRAQLAGTLTPAGVLVPILEHESQLSLILTRRSAELKHHAGQISFPGGRMEDFDTDVEAAALRETDEEIGIPSHRVSVVGYLDTMPTITGYAVTPVVGIVAAGGELSVDKREVEYAFEVPLTFLLDDRNAIPTERLLHGQNVPMIEFRWDGERIWGATAMMILDLKKKLIK